MARLKKVVIHSTDWRIVVLSSGKVRRIDLTSPESEPEPEPERMLLGQNAPMWFGWSTERAKIRGDGTLDPLYVADMAPFRVVRYMECARINGSKIATVGDMEQDGWDVWPSGNGAPISYLARHARLLGKRPWVCVPHLADDALVVHMAEQMAGLSPIVEYSNELGNTAMDQSKWAATQAGWTGSGDQRTYAYRWAAQRTDQIAKLWETIDEDAEFVLSMAPGTPYTETAPDTVDAFATNSYFGVEITWGGDWAWVQNTDLDGLLDWLEGEALDRCLMRIGKIDLQGRPLYCYEGGLHIWEYNHPHAEEAHTHPRMETIYTDWLNRLVAAGVEVNCHYFGADPSIFGIKSYAGQAAAECPKWGAHAAWGD